MNLPPQPRRGGRLTLVRSNKNKAPAALAEQGCQQVRLHQDSRQTIDPNQDPGRLQRVAAAPARHGFALYPLSGNTLFLTRFGMSRVLRDLDHAESFLNQVGG